MEGINVIEQKLIDLATKWTCSRRAITPQSTFYQDLYIVGDDLYELLVEITKRYGTSFEGFHFDTYVPNEGTALFYYWAMRLGFCKDSFPCLTIEHLASVVLRGKWFEPSGPNDGKNQIRE
jgi:hypothetical protein